MKEFEKIVEFENLYEAYKSAKRGSKQNRNIVRFMVNPLYNIDVLRNQLINKNYKVSPYNSFYIYEPKKRLVQSAAFKDKVIQHCLCDNVLIPVLEKRFINNNFAGRKGRGTHYGLNILKYHMFEFYKENGMDGYILKADISKFFYSIDHNILKQKLRCYFDDEDMLWLCDLIIDSTENPGLPLGNQTSQVFALMFLDELDHYITENLNVKYYGRYMDDFYILHKDKEFLKECLTIITERLSNIKLSLNNKTQIVPFKQGLKFLGFHTYINNGSVVCRLKNENKRNALRKYHKMAKKVCDGKLESDKFYECFKAWKAHASYGDCEQLIENFEDIINKTLEEKDVNND